ncbi:hypothetical protein [Antrihabitans stalagmiti]|uniref:hypothetical protein n=1 Tax=Antrihabitans stalagmiti TaxID=2799499 RepID=UPI001F165F5C|nr:hypothetical protein [Antrihabitans stalagmiti]
MIEQPQPLDEAVLGDLLLEYQLLRRATYLKALATQKNHPEVTDLAERLMVAR